MKKLSLALLPLFIIGASCSTQTNTNTATINANTGVVAETSNVNGNTATHTEGELSVSAQYPASWTEQTENIPDLHLSLMTNPDNSVDTHFVGPNQARLRVFYFLNSALENANTDIDELLAGDGSVLETEPQGNALGIVDTLIAHKEILIDGLPGQAYYVKSSTSGGEMSDYDYIAVIEAPYGVIKVQAFYGSGDNTDALKEDIENITNSLQFDWE